MKKSLTALLLILPVMFVITSVNSFAQNADTMFVTALPPGNLNTVIMGDTTASGARVNPNRVYVLQQDDPTTPYFITAPIYSNFNLTIIGKNDPKTGKPPVIEPFINSDNGSPARYISASGGNVTLKNVYLLATRPDGTTTTGYAVYTTADSISLTVDKCVFENFNNANIINNTGKHFKFKITNSAFRDIQSSFWQGGSIFWSNAGVPVDTAIFVNNTFYCIMRALYGSPGWFGYLQFEHNTVFLGEGQPMLAQQMVNGKINNNIFYGSFAHGADSTQIKSGSFNAAKQGPSLLAIDTLSTLTNPPYSLVEADRKVEVKNNAYYWPQKLQDYWKSVSDTAKQHPGLITPPVWMNPQTVKIFTDKTKWPGMIESGNVNVDPGFETVAAGKALDSLIKFTNTVWVKGSTGPFRWSQNLSDPLNLFAAVPSDWAKTKGYPVPEDLKYSNTTLQTAGTDGKAIGDLNWFPEQLATSVERNDGTVPSKFNLSQNYPNPFNPSTQINYSIAKAGMVTLNVFNVIGEKIATLVSNVQNAGSYSITFDASRLSSGIYFYRLESNGMISTHKMVLMK